MTWLALAHAAESTWAMPPTSVSRTRRRGLEAAWTTTSALSNAAARPSPVRTSPTQRVVPSGAGPADRDRMRTS